MGAFSQMEKAMTKEDTGQFQQTLNTFYMNLILFIQA